MECPTSGTPEQVATFGTVGTLVDTVDTVKMHSFHLAELPFAQTARALSAGPTTSSVPGLRHAEVLAMMQLGAPTLSPARMQLRRIAVFAEWTDEAALERFLHDNKLGRGLARGWHVRLRFLRRWGHVGAFADLPLRDPAFDDSSQGDEPVVAVTLARMRLPELPRFLKWGKPVERLVRDHPGTTLALAAMRPPRTISTFSVWRSAREMTGMVHGHSGVPEPSRHADAMVERERRDFHREFATYRFRVSSEHGIWQGRTGIVPD